MAFRGTLYRVINSTRKYHWGILSNQRAPERIQTESCAFLLTIMGWLLMY